MLYIMYSKLFQCFICFILDFMMFFVVLEQNFTYPKWWNLCFSCQNCLFSSPAIGCLHANFEPKSCHFWAYNVPVSSSTGAVFEPRSCQFQAQEDILSSPNRADFVPEPCIFRALFVLLSSPVGAVIEPCLCCYRALSCCVHLSTGWICGTAKLGDFFEQVSFSKHNRFDSWKQTHLGRFV